MSTGRVKYLRVRHPLRCRARLPFADDTVHCPRSPRPGQGASRMRRTTLLLAAIILTVQTGPAGAAPASPASPSAEQISQLVNRLSSSNFREREAASRELDALGATALEALKKAAASEDMEIASRAKSLADRITARIENEQRLAPALVDLKFKDTPIEQAINELAKQSGSQITLGPDRSKLNGRKVTLETGRVPFWVAMEKLCEAAQLRETESASPMASEMRTTQFQQLGGQPVQIVSYTSPNARTVQTLMLVDGNAPLTPAHVEGCVRVRLQPSGASLDKVGQGELALALSVQPEPRFKLERMFGIKVDKAIDDHGQVLDQVLVDSNVVTAPQDPREAAQIKAQLRLQLQLQQRELGNVPAAFNRGGFVELRLKKGEKEPKALRELHGTVAIGMRTPDEDLAVLEKPLDAKAGTSVQGKGNVILQFGSMKKLDNGDYEVVLDLQYANDIRPAPVAAMVPAAAAALRAQGGAGPATYSSPYGLILLGENDRPFELSTQRMVRGRSNGTTRTISLTLNYRSGSKDPGEPTKLVF